MNVLLTCAGRRNYLVQCFRDVVGPEGRVLAADTCAHAPALRDADVAFILPPLGDPGYIDRLLAVCRDERVGLLIPLNDFELPLLAANLARFLAIGTTPMISSPAVIERCFDKWATFTFLRANGIPTPQTYLTLDAARDALVCGEVAFPLVLKPRWGSGSFGIEYVWAMDELALVHALATRRYTRSIMPDRRMAAPDALILIQERLPGAEHGLDIVNDLAGRYVCTLAKRKLMMRSGETDRAATTRHAGLEQLGAQLGGLLGHVGILDCDVFLHGDTCAVLEMNPRFGGGYPFSHAAGANVPAALVAWARGETPNPAWLTIAPCVTASKYDRVAVMEPHNAATLDTWREGEDLIPATNPSCGRRSTRRR